MNWLIGLMLLVGSCSAAVGCTARINADVPSLDIQVQSKNCYRHYHWWGNRYHTHCE